MMKAPILRKQREIGGRALEVVVVHFYEQHMCGRSHQPHHDFRDDAALTKATKHRVEEIAVASVGTDYNLTVAGHDLKLLHVVDLKAKVVRGYAESAGANRSANRQKRIGNHRDGEFLGVRGHEDRVPLGAWPYLRGPARVGFGNADGIQATGVDDHAARDLGLAKKRMPLAAHGDLESLAVCELHELRDVLRIAGAEHGDRLLVHDASKVVGRRLQDGFIEGQLSAEILQVTAQRLCCGGVGPCRLQCKECRTACEPFAEVAARDSPLHWSPPWSDVTLPFVGLLKHLEFRRSRSRKAEILWDHLSKERFRILSRYSFCSSSSFLSAFVSALHLLM